jgi:hypothetical protein
VKNQLAQLRWENQENPHPILRKKVTAAEIEAVATVVAAARAAEGLRMPEGTVAADATVAAIPRKVLVMLEFALLVVTTGYFLLKTPGKRCLQDLKET